MKSESMNGLEDNLRDKMHQKLSQCTDAQKDLFRRMYNHKGLYLRDVDGIPLERMDWAFQQIERAIAKNNQKALAYTGTGEKCSDGIKIEEHEAILVTHQHNPDENGIYVGGKKK